MAQKVKEIETMPEETLDAVTNDAEETSPEEAGKAAVKETLYTAAELANAGRAKFGAPPEAVLTALKTAGKDKATLSEALEIVKKFMERPVK
jgi:hypothetical protein